MQGLLTKLKYPLVLLVSILSIVAVIFLTQHYFESRERQLRAEIEQKADLTDIVVAKMDLAAGDPINLETMEIKSIPYEYVPDGAVVPVQYQEFEHKYLSSPISEGKPLMRQAVQGVSRVERFSDLLAFGERAVTLDADNLTSMEFMLEAGDYIDLGVFYTENKTFDLLIEKIKVLSVGNFSIADPKFSGMYKEIEYETITLGVNSRYVKDVYEAQEAGDLIFLLRNEKDNSTVLYEELEGNQFSVTVYGGDPKDGVIPDHEDSVNQFPHSSKSIVSVRNDKGRIVQIASDNNKNK
ncbi:MAG: Flp pilus assembly protein CpaB [Cellvibrionales bacterium]|nr:Flp pilus assembly protein CpaB [Cellvibrionales bacterium]